MPDIPELIGGPYKAPRCKVGDMLFDVVKGDVAVAGVTDAPIPWPYTFARSNGTRGGFPALVVTEALADAIRVESAGAIRHHFGVGSTTVLLLRKALGVPRFNRGTTALWSSLADTRFKGLRGIPKGVTPRHLTPAQVSHFGRLASRGHSHSDIAERLGISTTAVLKRIRRSQPKPERGS